MPLRIWHRGVFVSDEGGWRYSRIFYGSGFSFQLLYSSNMITNFALHHSRDNLDAFEWVLNRMYISYRGLSHRNVDVKTKGGFFVGYFGRKRNVPITKDPRFKFRYT